MQAGHAESAGQACMHVCMNAPEGSLPQLPPQNQLAPCIGWGMTEQARAAARKHNLQKTPRAQRRRGRCESSSGMRLRSGVQRAAPPTRPACLLASWSKADVRVDRGAGRCSKNAKTMHQTRAQTSNEGRKGRREEAGKWQQAGEPHLKPRPVVDRSGERARGNGWFYAPVEPWEREGRTATQGAVAEHRVHKETVTVVQIRLLAVDTAPGAYAHTRATPLCSAAPHHHTSSMVVRAVACPYGAATLKQRPAPHTVGAAGRGQGARARRAVLRRAEER